MFANLQKVHFYKFLGKLLVILPIGDNEKNPIR